LSQSTKVSLLNKKWVFAEHNTALTQSLVQETGIDPILLAVLAHRGIDTPKKIEEFLHPSLNKLSPLETILNIRAAAECILQAIAQKKNITIYGDYDVDGVTGTTLLYSVLKELNAKNINYYVPHRFTEGYGLNMQAITDLHTSGTELLITVDCGISNYEEIKHARDLGMDVIVTDHHMPPVVLPEANFLVNPKLNNSDFAARNLSGVGVAFKLAEQLFQLQGHPPYSKTKKYLDLVVLGTIADIVPLLEENRILCMHGLEQINKRARTGIRALTEVAGLVDATLTVKDIGFGLAPRINAAGRMDSSVIAVELLLEENMHRAREIAQKLNQLNIERQETGERIKQSVIAAVEKLPHKDQEKVFILASAGWHPGIIGIVASQIVKQYNRPTALIALKEESGRGSIRSVEELDIFEPLSRCAYLLSDFGGHKEAAGFEIQADKVDEFKKKFTQLIEESIGFDNLIPSLKIDLELSSNDITFGLAKKLEELSPFGQSNQVPVFSTKDLSIYDFRKIGDNKHLKFSLTNGQTIFDGVGFGLGHLYDQLRSITKAEIAFSLSINEWQGQTKLQLLIKDIRSI
jgi:single-stranded-DNA-specific exonuclease